MGCRDFEANCVDRTSDAAPFGSEIIASRLLRKRYKSIFRCRSLEGFGNNLHVRRSETGSLGAPVQNSESGSDCVWSGQPIFAPIAIAVWRDDATEESGLFRIRERDLSYEHPAAVPSKDVFGTVFRDGM